VSQTPPPPPSSAGVIGPSRLSYRTQGMNATAKAKAWCLQAGAHESIYVMNLGRRFANHLVPRKFRPPPPPVPHLRTPSHPLGPSLSSDASLFRVASDPPRLSRLNASLWALLHPMHSARPAPAPAPAPWGPRPSVQTTTGDGPLVRRGGRPGGGDVHLPTPMPMPVVSAAASAAIPTGLAPLVVASLSGSWDSPLHPPPTCSP